MKGIWNSVLEFGKNLGQSLHQATRPLADRLRPIATWFYMFVPLWLGVLLLIGTVCLLESGTFEQLSDVFAPSTIGHHAAAVTLPFAILGEDRFPYVWLLAWLVALVVWIVGLRQIYRLLRDLAQEKAGATFGRAMRLAVNLESEPGSTTYVADEKGETK